jgi:hypothetical protein
MNGDMLVERRRWFRVFPEGSLEFTIITRVLALILLMALAVVGGTQRPLVVVSLTVVLWVDYALLVWWAVQVAMDLEEVVNRPAEDTPGRRAIIGIQAVLPSVAAVAALAPWGRMLATSAVGSVAPLRSLPIVAGLAFLVLLVPAYRALRKIGVGSPLWTGLLLVPILHWFALHRIAADLDRRIDGQLRTMGQEKASRRPGMALAVADVTWVLSVLPWAIVVAYSLIRGWPSGGAFKLGPVCGTALAALFAIANLAALEGVQRQIVTLIRKSS